MFRHVFASERITSLLQPMDQGVISALKRKYKRHFYSNSMLKIFKLQLNLSSAKRRRHSFSAPTFLQGLEMKSPKTQWRTHGPSFLTDHNQVKIWNLFPVLISPPLLAVFQAAHEWLFGMLKNGLIWVNLDNECPPWKPLTFEEIVEMSSDPSYEYRDNNKESETETDDEDESIPQGCPEPSSFGE